MELRQLELFLAVADELHFGRAAVRTHLSQPALTQAIGRFEQQLGARLFDRSTRRVALTPAGEALVDRARSLLAEAERTSTLVQRTARGEVGAVSLGVVGTAMLSVLPSLVRTVRRTYPDVRLALSEQTGVAQLQDLRAGRLDLGILHLDPAAAVDGVVLRGIADEGLGVVLPADHRLAHRSVLRLQELREDPLVHLRPEAEADTSRLYLGACAEAGFVPRATQHATSLQALLGFVAAGLGWGFVAESVVRGLRREGTTYVRLRGTTARLPTTLAWRADDIAPAAALVRDLVPAAGPDA